MTPHILITIDVEDWFQVENFKQCIPFSSWDKCELRVETNTHRLLDLLDSQHPGMSIPETVSSIQYPASGIQIRATFFVLGWLAERLPHLVREIHARGHEVASHGYYHNLCDQESCHALKKDLSDSKKLLEDIIGATVLGYRAPSFSINHHVLRLIEDCGYLYDSSFNSFNLHSRYGRMNLSKNDRQGIAIEISNTQSTSIVGQNPTSQATNEVSSMQHPGPSTFFELPISNFSLGRHVLPWGGGGYFRLIPFPLFKLGVESILAREGAYVLYLHPWEIDPNQPKVNGASAFFKFRHYVNLDKTLSKISLLTKAFSNCTFTTCRRYLEEIPTDEGFQE
jgi:polysaccharide deacetylase family protein (PEP-CTERM system associated)